MTYCCAIRLDAGLVLCTDSRTNAGTDQVNTYSKMHRFVWPGNRVLFLLSAGNLATTQGVIGRLNKDLERNAHINLLNLPTLADVAQYVGMISADVQRNQMEREINNVNFEATFILGGQIDTEAPAIFLIYPQGNFIHESPEHPFLQIGEIKYGKPILDRVIRPELSLEAAGRCALVSMSSTMRSNVTVGPPIELVLYSADSLQEGRVLVFDEDNQFFRSVTECWSNGLLQALDNLPRFFWEKNTDNTVSQDSAPHF
ncbi:peptidase [Acidithiobacillus caldus]